MRGEGQRRFYSCTNKSNYILFFFFFFPRFDKTAQDPISVFFWSFQQTGIKKKGFLMTRPICVISTV